MKTETVGDATLETWDAAEVAAAFDRDEIALIDVRTVQEYAFEHIRGALLLPLPFFEARKLPGQSDKRLVFHCGSGVRSEKVARQCIEAGFKKVAHMGGGFAAWKEAKLPYVGTDLATGSPKLIEP
ncbi:rhodanese-like domain-containing protein [Roseovarius salis]|uniref:rhodanese-like domain-containing protein n=1 Tax=Roseovarius salis TaxID=3376063 RepID=UPI0037C9EB68